MIASDLGVVVPVYNRARTVLTTLDAVARQTVRPRRLVVVDDGSTDDSSVAVTTWIRKQKSLTDVQLVRQSNRGVSTARNRGMALLDDCRFLAFLDSDDEWPVDFLERCRDALCRTPVAVAVTSDRHSIDVHGSSRHEDLRPLGRHPISWFLEYGAGVASCSLFRGDATRRLGGFPEHIRSGEDVALFMRLCLLGDWLHVPGTPVTFNGQRPYAQGEEISLSSKYYDNHRRWARVYEDFLLNQCGWRYVPEHDSRRLLARVWYRAGRELARHGAASEARQCHQRSLYWDAWNIKVWCKYAYCYTRPARGNLMPPAQTLSRAA